MARPLILLPPSEGKRAGGRGAPWSERTHRFPQLDGPRREVIHALRCVMHANGEACRTLLGVRSPAADVAIASNVALDSAPTMPAIQRYAGVLYESLDYRSLPRRLRDRIDAQVVIVSGLWGLVAPRDPIPDYKLKMGASLAPVGRLAMHWRPHLSPVLDEHVAGRAVWDLLPLEHASAWKHDGRSATRIGVRFLDDVPRDGVRQLVTVSHWN
ncbi:MAG TPA: peroxide stress protein YaaA, partial [Acidimicrobiales bacterium]|nr:peroxide stress protein YaaA [Acidimicrobiales bacterium]